MSDELEFAPVDDRSVQAYCERGEEEARLAEGIGLVEYLRTVEIIRRTLPAAPAQVADIGGGPGRYTDLLLDEGYSVTLRDIVPGHVATVRTRHPQGSALGDRLDAEVGDARALALPDDAFDAVLLLGPLYHLTERDDRIAALREAARIARPGAPVYAAAITRWAGRLDVMLSKRADLFFPGIEKLIDASEATGIIHPVAEGSFNGYTHRPDELATEIADAGLTVESVANVEGVAPFLGDLDARLADDDDRRRLLGVLSALESVPELSGVGPHLLVTARA